MVSVEGASVYFYTNLRSNWLLIKNVDWKLNIHNKQPVYCPEVWLLSKMFYCIALMLSHRREDILLNGSYQTVFQLIVSDEYDIMSEAPFLMFYCVILCNKTGCWMCIWRSILFQFIFNRWEPWHLYNSFWVRFQVRSRFFHSYLLIQFRNL